MTKKLSREDLVSIYTPKLISETCNEYYDLNQSNILGVIDFNSICRGLDLETNKPDEVIIYNIEDTDKKIEQLAQLLVDTINKYIPNVKSFVVSSPTKKFNIFNVKYGKIFDISYTEEEAEQIMPGSSKKFKNIDGFMVDPSKIEYSDESSDSESFKSMPLKSSNFTEKDVSVEQLSPEIKKKIENEKFNIQCMEAFSVVDKHQKTNQMQLYGRRNFVNYITKINLIKNFHINILNKVRSLKPDCEFIEISTANEDDLTLGFYVKNDYEKNNRPYAILSKDCDMIHVFSDIPTAYWFDLTYKESKRIIKPTKFWNIIDPSLTTIGKKILWGLFGSDYTFYLMSKHHIKRLRPIKNMPIKEAIIQQLKKYFNLTTLSDASLKCSIKRMTETFHEIEKNPKLCKIDMKKFMSAFDKLLNYEDCDIYIFTNNDKQFDSWKDYQNKTILNFDFMFEWKKYGDCPYYAFPDKPGELSKPHIPVIVFGKDGYELQYIRNHYKLITFD